MQTTGIVEEAPAAAARRDRQLYRLVEFNAFTEAMTALHAACGRGASELEKTVLNAAAAILGIEPRGESTLENLRAAALDPEFDEVVRRWVVELREVAAARPQTGACTVASALEIWSWSMQYFRAASFESGEAVNELTESLCPLVAARTFALSAADAPEQVRDLSHVYAARAAASAGSLCAELVFGYRRHLTWDAEGCATCYTADEIDDLEAIIPGFAGGVRATTDVIERDGTHPLKAGPCARFDGLDTFMRLRNRLDACLTGARLAKDRAADRLPGRS